MSANRAKDFRTLHPEIQKGPHATELIQRLSEGQYVTDEELTLEPK